MTKESSGLNPYVAPIETDDSIQRHTEKRPVGVTMVVYQFVISTIIFFLFWGLIHLFLMLFLSPKFLNSMNAISVHLCVAAPAFLLARRYFRASLKRLSRRKQFTI